MHNISVGPDRVDPLITITSAMSTVGLIIIWHPPSFGTQRRVFILYVYMPIYENTKYNKYYILYIFWYSLNHAISKH